MHIPKSNRKTIYTHIFSNGVLVAKKDFHAPKHMELDMPNLHVLLTARSLVRGRPERPPGARACAGRGA